MGQVTQAFPHLELESEVKQADKYGRQKWLVIYNAMIDPRPAAEIARHAECQRICTSSHPTIQPSRKPLFLDQVKAVGGTVI